VADSDSLVGIQEVGGEKPLAPTTLSLLASITYVAFADAGFWTIFGTFGTTEDNSNPNPHRSAQVLQNPTSSSIGYEPDTKTPLRDQRRWQGAHGVCCHSFLFSVFTKGGRNRVSKHLKATISDHRQFDAYQQSNFQLYPKRVFVQHLHAFSELR
jgi:hypothetical protein